MIKHRSKKIHMIGIGGAGMSPLAEVLVHLGYKVSGSDRQRTEVSSRLETLGISIQYDHTPHLIKEAELVAYSSAIQSDNPERTFATDHKQLQIRRAELLGDLMRAQPTVCVSGTHGKTTTTSLIGLLLLNAGLDPTVLVGGMLRENKSHALIGSGRLMVAEADEYDRSFLAMYPTIAVITNIDADHLDCYRDINDIKAAFVAFTRKVPFFGDVIACVDDGGVRDILPLVTATVTTYGIEREADYRATDITFSSGCARFDVVERGTEIGRFDLSIPGMHNVRNALAAIAVARLFDVDFPVIKKTFAEFRGVHRRFEILATVNGCTIVDDYAHHPREIQATIDAARKCGAGRVVAIFQPHLFSRTRDFLDDFAAVLMTADVVYVTAIYRAREEPLPGVTAEAIVDSMTGRGHHNAYYVADRRAVAELLPPVVHEGDYLLFMGAGDIRESAQRMEEVMHGTT
jgi:UDP-N-acetylmuramate--alanine ligase